MQHIQQLFSKALQGHDKGYDTAYFRSRIPELNQFSVSDAFIERSRAALLEYLRQADICSGCQGFHACGKQGDMQGFTQVLEPYKGQLNVSVQRCRPYIDHLAKKRVDRYASLAGMIELDESFQFENYPQEQSKKYPKLMRYAMEFAMGFQPDDQTPTTSGVYLFGPPGVGKTHLMLAVFNRLRERGVPCLVVRSDSLFDRMRHLIADSQDLEPFLDTLSTVPVLGIDEFAQERANDFTLEKLFRIVNHRFHANLPTWFTSNYAPPDAYRRRGEDVNDSVYPLRSRIMKMCMMAHLEGSDARQRHLRSLT
ncbi:AFG1/ZapE family ATPase [Alicyclobacillus fastidiosus]|uniref:ATP-binding protein n=1 Tax=Alicyclobacillus fastidiosus TaxID=392011 RepID=A0ABV5AFZ9_9BACL|nr:AFG1/ZapE family ATPase [Alicyclobacillus fastidiosus]WEH11697.1 ATP-binding protein [Alicyclobacillus fastidiosus]